MSEWINKFVRKFNFLKKFPLFGSDLFILRQKVYTSWKVSIFGVFLVQIRENTDQKSSNFETFLRSESLQVLTHFVLVFEFIPILSSILQYFLKHWKELERLHEMGHYSPLISSPSNTHCTKKWSFPLRISSVYVNKSAWNCRFGHIYWRNSQWKTSFFGAVYSVSLN